MVPLVRARVSLLQVLALARRRDTHVRCAGVVVGLSWLAVEGV